MVDSDRIVSSTCKSSRKSLKKDETMKQYTCEKCHVRFPEKDERYGQCRECNEAEGYCYDCELIVGLKNEMLEMLRELCDNDDVYYKIKSVSTRAKLRKLIAKAEGGE